MCRNIVSEGVLSILNAKQNAEGSYISCGPALSPQGCWKQVAQDVLWKRVCWLCVMAGFHKNDYSVDNTSGRIMCPSGFLSTYYYIQYLYKRKRDSPPLSKIKENFEKE